MTNFYDYRLEFSQEGPNEIIILNSYKKINFNVTVKTAFFGIGNNEVTNMSVEVVIKYCNYYKNYYNNYYNIKIAFL